MTPWHDTMKNIWLCISFIQQHLITTICVNIFQQSRNGRLTKNTAYILYNRSFSLTLTIIWWVLFCIKVSSTNSGHYLSIVKVCDICCECDDVNILKLRLTFCVTLILFILFYKRGRLWKHLRGIELVPMDAICWMSWWEGIKTPCSTGCSWRLLSIADFRSVLLPIFIH